MDTMVKRNKQYVVLVSIRKSGLEPQWRGWRLHKGTPKPHAHIRLGLRPSSNLVRPRRPNQTLQFNPVTTRTRLLDMVRTQLVKPGYMTEIRWVSVSPSGTQAGREFLLFWSELQRNSHSFCKRALFSTFLYVFRS